MKVYIILNDNDQLVGIFSSKEKLDIALNGQTDYIVEEAELDDPNIKARPVWEITLKNEVIDKVVGPYYVFYKAGYTNLRRGFEEYNWVTVQAETEEEARKIAEEVIKE